MSNAKDLENLLKHFIDRGVPGVSISIYQDERKLYEGIFGHRDLAKTQPLTADTLFRMYSMTKPVSALCGMIQYERGVFKMDDPVSDYLPEYKNLKVSVKQPDGSWTVEESKVPMLMKHLFNMNVGFFAHDGSPTDIGMQEMHKRLGGTKYMAHYTRLTEIRALAEVPMLFEPGTRWQYGYGLDIMAAVVEVTSGLSLGEFMKRNIFDPLGMNDTWYRFRDGWEERMVECVRRNKEGEIVACHDAIGEPLDACHSPECIYESASTGLLSTLDDYQKFCRMLANGGELNGERVIGRKTIDMMRQNLLNDVLMKDFEKNTLLGYGYGYGVRTLIDPAKGLCNGSVGEFGWCGAAGTWMCVDPSEKLAVTFMQQEMMSNEAYMQPRLRAVINGMLK